MFKIIFYDTCALLELQEKAFEEFFYISSVTLMELENIKTSNNKDNEIKYKARHLIKLLEENEEKFSTVFADEGIKHIVKEHYCEETNDNLIIACALEVQDEYKLISKEQSDYSDANVTFVTGDITCKTIAKEIFNLSTRYITDDYVEYKGFKEIVLSDEDMAIFFSHLDKNLYDLLTNEYIIIKNTENETVYTGHWDGEKIESTRFPNIRSRRFGIIRPIKGDYYQQLALDSFDRNKLTVIKGKAGTGKSHLALGYLLSLLEKEVIDKIIVFCNTVATVGSAKLGYYPGTRLEKLCDSSIGTMLSSKLGGKEGLYSLLDNEQLELLPMSDIRGYDTSGVRAGIYITEAQNLDITLMKLALQRIGEDSLCIIDGDYNTQVDSKAYAGYNNGMRRLSEVFRGQDFYGEVELQNIYRSEIARIADLM